MSSPLEINEISNPYLDDPYFYLSFTGDSDYYKIRYNDIKNSMKEYGKLKNYVPLDILKYSILYAGLMKKGNREFNCRVHSCNKIKEELNTVLRVLFNDGKQEMYDELRKILCHNKIVPPNFNHLKNPPALIDELETLKKTLPGDECCGYKINILILIKTLEEFIRNKKNELPTHKYSTHKYSNHTSNTLFDEQDYFFMQKFNLPPDSKIAVVGDLHGGFINLLNFINFY